jgi:hypothetical protein
MPSQRRGVIGRSVSERSEHNRIIAEVFGFACAPRGSQRKRQSGGFGQMRSNRAGLRRNPHRAAAPNFVATFGNRIVFRRAKRQQGVENHIHASFARLRGHQSAGAVMQKTRIIQSQQRTDDGVVFVAGAADGVKTFVAAFQFARSDIQQAAGDLIFKKFQRLSDCQQTVWPQFVSRRKFVGSGLSSCKVVVKAVLNDFDARQWSSHKSQVTNVTR